MTLMTFAVGGLAYWMPDYVHTFRHAGDLEHVAFTFGAITAVAGLISTLAGGWAGDKLRSRFGGSYFLVSGWGMMLAVPLFLAALFVPFPAAWVLIFITEFCLFFNTGPSNTILANVTNPAVRASAFALNIFIIHALGDVISPPLIGWISDLTGGNMNAGFAAVSLAMFLSGVFWLLGSKHLAQDTARISSCRELIAANAAISTFQASDPETALDRDGSAAGLRRAAETRRGRLPNTPAAGRRRRRPSTAKAWIRLRLLRVLDVAQRHELAHVDIDAGFFFRFAHGGVDQRFALIGQTLGNAPRRLAVVVARGVHQQHFDLVASASIHDQPCRFHHFR